MDSSCVSDFVAYGSLATTFVIYFQPFQRYCVFYDESHFLADRNGRAYATVYIASVCRRL